MGGGAPCPIITVYTLQTKRSECDATRSFCQPVKALASDGHSWKSLHQYVGRRRVFRPARRGEVEDGGVNLFPIMLPVSRSPGEFVVASCMFMTRHCGRPARGPAGGGGGGGGRGAGSSPETPIQANIRDPGRRFVVVSSSLGAEMMEWLSPTTLSQHSFNKSTCD